MCTLVMHLICRKREERVVNIAIQTLLVQKAELLLIVFSIKNESIDAMQTKHFLYHKKQSYLVMKWPRIVRNRWRSFIQQILALRYS